MVGSVMVDTVKHRKPKFHEPELAPSGRVTHDDRGNALWEWHGNREEVHGNFYHLGLAVQDSELAAKKPSDETVKSGEALYKVDHSAQDKPFKRRHLRALSRHIAEQRKRAKETNG